MNTLDYIVNKYNVKGQVSPIEISCSRLVSFPRLFNQLGFTIGAEVGVERGYFSRTLCQKMPGLKLYAIDIWDLLEEKDDKTQRDAEQLYQDAKQRLEHFNCTIIKDWSINAVKKFAAESLDFVYIDAGHDYKSAKEDIQEWSKKVKKGGIVAGHDYIDPEALIVGNRTHDSYDVKKAVDDFVKENKIGPLFVFTKDFPGKSSIDKRKALAPSWFYVKT